MIRSDISREWVETLKTIGDYGSLIFAIIICLCVLALVAGVLERPLSKLLKAKTVRVEIRDIIRNKKAENQNAYTVYTSNKASRKEKVEVAVLGEKKKIRKVFMPCDGLEIGDIGQLTYQGRFGLQFVKETSEGERREKRGYHFGFEKKEEKKEEDPQKKRKYW